MCSAVLTRVQARVLLDVRELLEAAVTVAALVRFLARMHADVLHELVVRREGLEALLALMGLDLRTSTWHAAGTSARSLHSLSRVHLHRRLVHEDLRDNI